MTQREFSQLTGKPETDDDFEQEFRMAERTYYAAGNLGKHTFCSDWKKIRYTDTVDCLTETVEKLKEANQRKRDAMETAAWGLLEIASSMEDLALADAISRQVAYLVGIKSCIKYKVAKRQRLSDKEIEFVKESIDMRD